MLIEGDFPVTAHKPAEGFRQPVCIPKADPFEIFAEVPSGGLCAARTGSVADREGDPGIIGSGPERGLAQARMTVNDDSVPVDLALRFQTVDGTGDPPGPGADGSEIPVGRGPFLRLVEKTHHAGIETVAAVRKDIIESDRRRRESGAESLFEAPAPLELSPSGFIFPGVVEPGRPACRIPFEREEGHVRIVRAGMIALEIEPEENRNGTGSFRRDVKQQMKNLFPAAVPADDVDLPADCQSLESAPFAAFPEDQFLAAGRDRTVQIFLHDAKQRGPDPVEKNGGRTSLRDRQGRQFIRRDPFRIDVHPVGDVLYFRRKIFFGELV